MKLTLIVPACNEENYIGQCLDSILLNARGKLHEIIVVDNASTDRTADIARTRPGVRIVYESRRGITNARQRGLEEATGNVLAYIDADTRLPLEWIDIVEETFENQPDIVCISGPYLYYDGPRIKRWLLKAMYWSVLPIGYKVFGFMVIGGNFVTTKKAIKDAGEFDRTIDFYGEDTDIGRRLKLRGRMSFRLDLFVHASARRFYAEGLFKTNITYLVNFLWVILFHRPFSASHRDIRTIFSTE